MSKHQEMAAETPEKTTDEVADLERILVITLGKDQYGIPLPQVREVVAVTDFTPIPHSQPFFKGIMNLRGSVISVIDFRIKLKILPSSNTSENAIVILDLGTHTFGCIVDSVDCVHSVRRTEIGDSPDIESGKKANFLAGVIQREKSLILLLDTEKCLEVQDLNLIKNQSLSPKTAA